MSRAKTFLNLAEEAGAGLKWHKPSPSEHSSYGMEGTLRAVSNGVSTDVDPIDKNGVGVFCIITEDDRVVITFNTTNTALSSYDDSGEFWKVVRDGFTAPNKITSEWLEDNGYNEWM